MANRPIDTFTATGAAAVTPSDTVAISPTGVRALYIGVGGDVAAVLADTTTAITFKNASAGSVIPVQAVRVNATNTTATNIVALY